MIEQWHGCYDDGWKGLITPESFSHPAKYSRGLIERIYRHCLDRGYLRKGDLVADCFGGIGTGGIMSAYAGLRWIGCELEPRFVEFAKANFALHASKLRQLGLPEPQIIQGDSRQFDRLVGQAVGVISSPPFTSPCCQPVSGYGGSCSRGGQGVRSEMRQVAGGPEANYGTSPGQIGSLPAGDVVGVIASPPYSDIAAGQGGLNTKPPKKPGQQSGRTPTLASQNADQHYGATEGQIGKLPPGDLSAVVASPPYAEDEVHGRPSKMTEGIFKGRTAKTGLGDYGKTEGQIGRLKGGQVDAVCASPPYATDVVHGGHGLKLEKFKDPKRVGVTSHALGKNEMQRYGETEGNIGNGGQETYWQAVRDVYAACFRAIKPGGVMVLVTKNYVKARRIVPLSDDTVTLCQSLGFTLIERIQAMLVSETRHADLFQGEDVKRKERKSFFRRLAEKKGSPRIDSEDVLIFRRP